MTEARPELDFGWPPVNFVNAAGTRMAYREWGSPEAPQTVVAVHGLTSCSLTWRRVGPALARRYRVLAPDLKGHGDTPYAPTGFRIHDQAREVASFCDALGLRRPTVLGHSWGGAIALSLAVTEGAGDRLLLVDPWMADRDRDLEGWGSWDESAKLLASWMGLSQQEAETIIPPALGDSPSDEDIAEAIMAATKGNRAAVTSVFAENGDGLKGYLSVIRCPTLLLYAAQHLGGVMDADSLARAEANPSVQAVLVPGAGHDIHRTHFDDFIEHVERFLGAPGAA